MRKQLFIMCLLASIWFTGCEDVIDVNLQEGDAQLNVDGWVNNLSETQTIRLTLTQAYFNQSFNPSATGATVSVTDLTDTVTYNFTEADNGNYIWQPTVEGDVIGKLEHDYKLTIDYAGEKYEALSRMNRTPQIDSLTYIYYENEPFTPDGHYVQFYARDFEGTGDCYWIRTTKWAKDVNYLGLPPEVNEAGLFLNTPADLNIAYDAGFSAGGNIDGVVFIEPIQNTINPAYEDEGGEALSPYELGDSLRVEIWSITEEHFNFFIRLRDEVNNGGLFATPSSNLPTNVINTNANSSKQAVGFFGATAVSGLGGIVGETIPESLKPR